MARAVIMACGFLFYSIQGAAQGVSVRTNLAWDAAAEPNLGLEIPLSNHFSLGANAGIKTWPRWLFWDTENIQNTTLWRNFAIVPEARYYFNQMYEGWFLAADAVYTHYNVGNVKFPFGLYPEVRDYRLQGDFYGAGLSAGHSWWLGRHWRIEAEAGVGVGYVKAAKFECAHCGAQVGTKEGVALVPKVGVNIAYNFKRREQKKQEVLEIIAQPTPDRVLRKEKGALYVFFPMNKASLERSFVEGGRTRDNGAALDEIMQVTADILKDSVAGVSCIQIVGLASVDGPAQGNEALSLSRAKALQQYIQDRLPVPDDLFETVDGGEAWTELKDIIKDLQAGVGESSLTQVQLEKVLDILENEADSAARERKLRALEGGRVYRILVDSLLKDLRNSGYVRVYIEEK